MKKVIVGAALALVSLSPALASSHYEMTYHDNIRPNGRPRPQAVPDAALDACYAQAGLPAQCAGFTGVQGLHDDARLCLDIDETVQNSPGKSVVSAIPRGYFIDPDTGLLCHNTGGASICETPPDNLTIRYTSKSGLNCTRTGMVGICSSS
jgi:hypothetical protein